MSADYHRSLVTKSLKLVPTWQKCSPSWMADIKRLTDNLSDAEAVLNLGSHLSEIFRGTGGSGRSQGELSSGGVGWECLVTYYLNLVFTGTNGVAMRHSKGLVPEPLRDATTVSYGNHQTNSESDICVVIYPQDFAFPPADSRNYMKALDKEVGRRFVDMQLGVIQCKTNWNDNAQIPMLWDMVYRAQFGAGSRIKIGRNGRNVRGLLRPSGEEASLKGFTYSFVTVPTNKAQFKPTSTAVKRVDSLSGGNYWGKPTQDGVALSLKEIFLANFGDAFPQSVPPSIQTAIDNRIGEYP